MILIPYLHVSHRVDFGVVAKHPFFHCLHVLPPFLLLDVDCHQDFVDSVKEFGVVVVSFLDPFGQSGQAWAVYGVNAFVSLSVTEVVADLVARSGSAFGYVKLSGMALDLPDRLVGGSSANNGVPGLLP